MAHIFTPEQERLLLLSELTYKSNSTLEIAEATDEIRTYIFQNYPKSFSKLQKLITLKSQVDLNTRKSLISQIKMVSLELKQQLQNQAQHSPDILSNNKKLLHDVQHILTNNQIEAELKQPITRTYVQIFALFMPETFDKLISKARYYFNTKEDIVALQILQSYHNSQAPFKYKYEFYDKVLTLLSYYIYQKVKALYSNTLPDYNKHVVYLGSHLTLFVDIWTSMNFEKHQSTLMKELNSENFISMFQMSLSKEFPKHYLQYLYLIASHVTPSLRRTGLYKNARAFCSLLETHITQVLDQFIARQFLLNDMTEDYELRHYCGSLKLLVAAVDTFNQGLHLIRHKFSLLQLYTKLIYPNFKNIQKYLYNHSQNPEEIYAFLDDLSFGMKSESPQILIHKFTISLAKHSPSLLSDIRTLIYTFLYDYLPHLDQAFNKQFKVKYDLSLSLPFWSHISTFISLKEEFLSILLLTSITVTTFLSDIQFLADLNDFLGLNANSFLLSEPQIEFFSLLIYRNYRADIFSDNKSSLFKGNLIKKCLQLGNNCFNRNFILKILLQQLSDRPCFDDIFFSIQMILNAMSQSFNEQLLQILIQIVRNYWQDLGKLKAIKHITRQILSILEMWALEQIQLKRLEEYFELVSLLISVEKGPPCEQLFSQTLEIIQKASTRHLVRGQLVLGIFTAFLNNSGCLPQSIELLLLHFEWQFTDIKLVNQWNKIIRYSANQEFMNWLMVRLCAEEFTVTSAFIMTILTYYKGNFLNRQTIKMLFAKIYQYRFLNSGKLNYIHGKLNIVCLLLLRQQKQTVYDLLLGESWEYLQFEVRKKERFASLFSKPKESSLLPIIDQVYHMLYASDNVYRLKYEVQAFLIIQLKLFQSSLNDFYQLSYANIAMVACIANVLRAYEHYKEYNTDFIPQDYEEEVSSCQLACQFKRHSEILEGFEKPEEFKEDYFVLFRSCYNRLRSKHQSNLWLQTILKKVFSTEDCENIQQLLKVSKCNGEKVRSIMKIQRIRGQV